jgi:hypothetical protein
MKRKSRTGFLRQGTTHSHTFFLFIRFLSLETVVLEEEESEPLSRPSQGEIQHVFLSGR